MKKKSWMIAFTVLIIIFGGIFTFNLVRSLMVKKFLSNYKSPPQVVSTILVQTQNWQPILSVVGQISTYNGVNIASETAGRVSKIYISAGQHVKAGDKLIQLNDDAETAQLKSVEAKLRNADLNLKRVKHLLDQQAISQGAYDDAVSNHKQLQANYDNLLALKSKKLLKAPFEGEIGLVPIRLGEFVNPGQKCLSLQTLDMMYVTFSVSQKDYGNLWLGQTVEISIDAYPNQKFIAHISAFDAGFNEETHTIEVQAGIEPSNIRLLPGMFVDVNILLALQQDVIVVPQTTLTYSLYGESAYIVNYDKIQNDGTEKIVKDKNGFYLGKVKKVYVKTGDKRENSVVITEGLKAGDVVVDSGQSKIEDGSSVAVNNNILLPEHAVE